MTNLNTVTVLRRPRRRKKGLDAMATMKMTKKNIKDIKVDEDKGKEENRLAVLLATFKKINNLYSPVKKINNLYSPVTGRCRYRLPVVMVEGTGTGPGPGTKYSILTQVSRLF